MGEISSNSFSNFKERAVQWTVATIKFAEQELESPGRGTGASFGRSKGFLDAAFGLARNDSQATESYATIEVAEQEFEYPGRGIGASFGRGKGFLDAAFGLARNDSQATDSYATIKFA